MCKEGRRRGEEKTIYRGKPRARAQARPRDSVSGIPTIILRILSYIITRKRVER
jgi:hypothetical protein